jgi:hypothetical protein
MQARRADLRPERAYDRVVLGIAGVVVVEEGPHELGMPRAAVIALARVLHDELPVRLLDQRHLMRELRVGQILRLQIRRERRPIGLEVRRLVGETDEDRAFHRLDVDGLERDTAGIEALMHAAGIEQFAREVVGPLVVGAGKAQALAALGVADLEAAVAARIEEGADLARAVAQHDDRAPADGQGEILPGAGDFADGAGENPLPLKNQLEVEVVKRGIAVEALRKREKFLAGFE